jgi:membrane protein YdbS with pleckstrin-like domain
MSAPVPGADRPDVPDQGDRRRLSARAVVYWRIVLTTWVVAVAGGATVLLLLVIDAGTVVRIAGVALAWVLGLASVAIVPPILWRVWWYEIGDEQVDLQQGLLVVTRTVIPMVRVQHVDLHRGPLTTRLGLAEIELHTAAGSVTIPALDADEAERIRTQVAVLARVPDDL